MALAIVDGKEFKITDYDLTPYGIREYLKLDKVKFKDTCTWDISEEDLNGINSQALLVATNIFSSSLKNF